ncbi:MAG: peptide-methionine (S)-S-oxide reductase MsrA [Pseudomonadota bacterium]
MLFSRKPLEIPSPEKALPGRAEPIPTAASHIVFDRPLRGDRPDHLETVVFGMGCFWGAERKFWETEGVWLTMAGYAGGTTPNPTYREVCSGQTGHTEVVEIVFDPSRISFDALLKIFWENHDPTQGMRQGNDIGTQYRSAIYTTTDDQYEAATASRRAYGAALAAAGRPSDITTEIAPLDAVFLAEADHQQYLAKNPNGYCGMGGTGVSCPIGAGVTL